MSERSSARADAVPVRLESVTLRYPGSPDGAAPALADASLRVPAGRLVALAGPNGSGKTTLLRLVAGELDPTEGTVAVFGDVPSRRSAELRRRVAYVPQSLALDPEATGRETLELFAALEGVARSRRAAAIAEVAETFGVREHLGKRVARLSGGLKRRLHLAAGFLGAPDLLLLDEPAASLDSEGQERLWALVAARCAAGAAAIVSTHDPAAARRADRVLKLEGGVLAREARA
jgi:ABC-2 type transport system ATP-binding protein